MPSTRGLGVLVRENKLTDEEWFGLIEARRELIKPHLDSFTLQELGSLRCMRNRDSYSSLLRLDVSTSTGDERFSLKTQGVFWLIAREQIPNPGWPDYPNGTKRVWGLTRSGLWVLVTIGFVTERGYKERGYERAKTVEVIEADMPTIATKTKCKPRWMWKKLGEAIEGFAERRRSLYNQALGLARLVQIEELALSLFDFEEDEFAGLS